MVYLQKEQPLSSSSLGKKFFERHIIINTFLTGFALGIGLQFSLNMPGAEESVLITDILYLLASSLFFGIVGGIVYFPFGFAIGLVTRRFVEKITNRYFLVIQDSRRYVRIISIASFIFLVTIFFLLPNAYLSIKELELIQVTDDCLRVAFFGYCGAGGSGRYAGFILPKMPFYIGWFLSLMFPVYTSFRMAQLHLEAIGKEPEKQKIGDIKSK